MNELSGQLHCSNQFDNSKLNCKTKVQPLMDTSIHNIS
jgi:hypothetical protein